MSVVDCWRPETGAGGFTRDNEAIEFYTRINALVHHDMVVVDLGAALASTRAARRFASRSAISMAA